MSEPEDPNDTEGFLLTTLAPQFPFFRQMMCEHPRTMVNKFSQDTFYIRCSSGTELIEETVWLGLYLPHTPTNVLMAFLREVLGEGESRKPDIRLIIGRDWGTGGISIIDEIPSYCNVVDLCLGAWQTLKDFGAEGILRCLARTTSLPRLQRLIISGDGWDGGEVKAILKERYDQADEATPSLRLRLIGRGVNVDYHLI